MSCNRLGIMNWKHFSSFLKSQKSRKFFSSDSFVSYKNNWRSFKHTLYKNFFSGVQEQYFNFLNKLNQLYSIHELLIYGYSSDIAWGRRKSSKLKTLVELGKSVLQSLFFLAIQKLISIFKCFSFRIFLYISLLGKANKMFRTRKQPLGTYPVEPALHRLLISSQTLVGTKQNLAALRSPFCRSRSLLKTKLPSYSVIQHVITYIFFTY